jgi:hypothetical protein
MNHCEIWSSGGVTWLALRVFGEGFQRTVDSLKATFHRRCRFDGTQRAWRIYASVSEVRRWALGHFDAYEIAIEADYGGYEYQSSRHGHQERQHQSARAPSKLDAAYSTLYVLPTAPREVVLAAHRALVKLHHPDAGGDTAVMSRINDSLDTIKERW